MSNALSSIDIFDVIVLKKSPIETKIFTSVLSKMCESVEAATSYNDLKQKIESKHYKVVLFDKEMLLEDANTFLEWILSIEKSHHVGKINTIMFIDPKDKNQDISVAFDAILPNQISKKDLEILIHKFI
jgi:CheY-like chemotaxis protein